MPLYRCVAGCAEIEEEPKRQLDDGTLAFKRIRAGDTFESNKNYLNLNVGGHVKFELVYGSSMAAGIATDPNMDVWDRNRESLEQFVERMKLKGQMAAAGIVAVPAVGMVHVNPNPQGEQLGAMAPAQVPQQPQQDQGTRPVPPGQQGIPPANRANLEEMDERKLRAIAEENEVDVSKCRGKADLVKALKGVVLQPR